MLYPGWVGVTYGEESGSYIENGQDLLTDMVLEKGNMTVDGEVCSGRVLECILGVMLVCDFRVVTEIDSFRHWPVSETIRQCWQNFTRMMKNYDGVEVVFGVLEYVKRFATLDCGPSPIGYVEALLQLVLTGCSSGVCKRGHDDDSLLRGSVRSPRGTTSSTHGHSCCLRIRVSTKALHRSRGEVLTGHMITTTILLRRSVASRARLSLRLQESCGSYFMGLLGSLLGSFLFRCFFAARDSRMHHRIAGNTGLIVALLTGHDGVVWEVLLARRAS